MSTSPRTPNLPQKSFGSVYMKGEKYPLPQQVIDNIESVIGFQVKQEQIAPWHDQLLNKVSAIFGRSYFLYAQLIFFIIWISWSHVTGDATLPFNFPKYNLQDQSLDMAALLISTGVLIRQSRQEKLAEQRSHLMLQINLLTEQKTAKIIALLEELRTDSPSLNDRHDWEAEILQQATDPQVVLNILQENLNAVPDTSELSNLDAEQLVTEN